MHFNVSIVIEFQMISPCARTMFSRAKECDRHAHTHTHREGKKKREKDEIEGDSEKRQ